MRGAGVCVREPLYLVGFAGEARWGARGFLPFFFSFFFFMFLYKYSGLAEIFPAAIFVTMAARGFVLNFNWDES